MNFFSTVTLKRVALQTSVVLWMALIFAFSAQTAPESNALSGETIRRVAEFMSPGFHSLDGAQQEAFISSLQHVVRKTTHGLVYLVLGVLSMATFLQYSLKMRTRVISSFMLCALYAVTDELHQLFTDGRSGEISDVFIDSVGALLGIGLVVLALRLKTRGRQPM